MSALARPRPRGSTLAAITFAGLLGLVAGLVVAGRIGDDGDARRAATADLVAALGLGDLALFTEARYTRHPSLADLHSAFQDGPGGLEHFPTGSLVVAPRALPAGRLGPGEE